MKKYIGLVLMFPIWVSSLFAQNQVDTVFLLRGHKAGISSLTFSPDSKTLVSGSQDETMKIWDVTSQKEIKAISNFGSAPTSLAFSPDGQFLAVGNYGTIAVFQTRNWKKNKKKVCFPSFVENMVVVPGQTKLVASSWKEKSLIMMDFPSLSNEKVLKEDNWTDAISLSKNGQLIVTGSHSNSLKIWEVSSGELVNQFQNHDDWVYGCYFFDNDRKIVSVSLDKNILVSDAKTGKVLQKKLAHEDGISYAAISIDEKLLVTTSLDKTLKIWNLDSLELLYTYAGSKEKLITLAASPNGKWLAAGGSDQLIHLIKLK